MAYVPRLGNRGGMPGELQLSASRYDALSFRTTPIEQLSVDGLNTCLGHASGFFWQRNGSAYLITNRHVLTCLDSFTGERLNASGFMPEKIRFFSGSWIKTGQEQNFERQPVICDLYKADGKAAWRQHRDYKDLRVDIVVLPIGDRLVAVDANDGLYVNDFGYEKLYHHVGSDVFITGYPFRNYDGMMIPIWKRGTLAAEPGFPVDGKPMFLIDALTMSGMSGSPVYRRVFGPAYYPSGVIKIDSVVTTEFVGVYSGRMASKELQHAGLGIAWYANLIDSIIDVGYSPSLDEVFQSNE